MAWYDERSFVVRGRPNHWQPVELATLWGVDTALPAACRCDRQLNQPHSEPTCPYIDPESWYAAEVERMRELAPA